MRARLRSENGQALVISVLFLFVLIGATALTLDVGSWYREQRQAQATADESALAGAQALPTDTARATTLAQQYALLNGGVAAASAIAALFRKLFRRTSIPSALCAPSSASAASTPPSPQPISQLFFPASETPRERM